MNDNNLTDSLVLADELYTTGCTTPEMVSDDIINPQQISRATLQFSFDDLGNFIESDK
jgi:hypothetical protein